MSMQNTAKESSLDETAGESKGESSGTNQRLKAHHSSTPNQMPNQITILDSSVAVIRLGSSSDTTALLNEQRLEHLSRCLESFIQQKLKGVILTGFSEDIFSGGADISVIDQIQGSTEGQDLSTLGQSIFDRIAHYPVPVIAAVSGQCIGGALELALACHSRIASDKKSTQFSLPELKLGIIPGFGGTQRLPRTVGLPKAMELILSGKSISADEAYKIGLVNKVTPVNHLIQAAESMILEGGSDRSKISLKDKFLTYTGFGRNLVKARCESEIAKHNGHYPAPQRALELAILGLEKGLGAGLRAEAEAVGELIVTPESRSLVKLFFLTESAKKLGRSGKKALEGLHAAILGADELGIELSVNLARREFPVILRDGSPDALTRAMNQIREQIGNITNKSSLNKEPLSDADKSFIINRVNPTSGTPAAIGSVQVVFDTSFSTTEDESNSQNQENSPLANLTEISSMVQPATLLAVSSRMGFTDSSKLRNLVNKIAHPERLLGMNFFPKTYDSHLVEIVRTPDTGMRQLALAAALIHGLRRYPIIIEDSVGGIVQRILAPQLMAALLLWQEGVSIARIDSAVREFGFAKGPFEYLEEIGLDSASLLFRLLKESYGDRMGSGLSTLSLLSEKGMSGKPNSGVFYVQNAGSRTTNPQAESLFKTQAKKEDLSDAAILPLLVYPVVNEAIRALDEGVAGQPGIEAGFQIDLASIFGFGFPPFKGGILHYADRIGAKTILHHLHNCERVYGSLFKPAKGLAQRSASGRSVYDPIG